MQIYARLFWRYSRRPRLLPKGLSLVLRDSSRSQTVLVAVSAKIAPPPARLFSNFWQTRGGTYVVRLVSFALVHLVLQHVGPTKVKDALRASSAAPIYFASKFIDGVEVSAHAKPVANARNVFAQYVDGGVAYNNPAEICESEAKRLFGKNRDVCVFSALG